MLGCAIESRQRDGYSDAMVRSIWTLAAFWKLLAAISIAACSLVCLSTHSVAEDRHAVAEDIALAAPDGVCVNREGELFIADYGAHAILKRDAAGQWRRIAGDRAS